MKNAPSMTLKSVRVHCNDDVIFHLIHAVMKKPDTKSSSCLHISSSLYSKVLYIGNQVYTKNYNKAVKKNLICATKSPK